MKTSCVFLERKEATLFGQKKRKVNWRLSDGEKDYDIHNSKCDNYKCLFKFMFIESDWYIHKWLLYFGYLLSSQTLLKHLICCTWFARFSEFSMGELAVIRTYTGWKKKHSFVLCLKLSEISHCLISNYLCMYSVKIFRFHDHRPSTIKITHLFDIHIIVTQLLFSSIGK